MNWGLGLTRLYLVLWASWALLLVIVTIDRISSPWEASVVVLFGGVLPGVLLLL